MLKLCKVCLRGQISQGNLFCEACRSFYRRNKDKQLVCKTGLGQCMLSVTGFENPALSPHRNLCKGCRLEKCLQLESDFLSAHNRRTTMGLELANSSVTKVDVEGTFVTLANAASILQQRMNQLTWRIRPIENCRNGYDFFQFYLDSIKEQVLCMKEFAKCFPVYSEMSVQDRVTFFLSSQFRVILGEGFIHSEKLYLNCFSSDNFQTCVSGKTKSYACFNPTTEFRLLQRCKGLTTT